MSLIVARKSEGQLCIVSDTKLTYPNHEIKGLKTNPSDGVIKTVVLRSDVSISFAGDIDDAENALKEIDTNLSIDTIKNILQRYHVQSNFRTEFLLCYASPIPTIYKFKKGEYGEVVTAWIGDQNAFDCFQRSMMGVINKERKKEKINNRQKRDYSSIEPTIRVEEMNINMEIALPEYFSKMSKAMDEVISNGNISSVGGFKVNVIYKEKFYYNIYTKNYRGNFVIIGEGSHAIGPGDASEGAYSVNFFGNSSDYNTVALHIRQANLGIAYHRDNGGLLRPHLHNLDEVDFYDLAIERYNLYAPITTQDRVQKFTNEGRHAFSQMDFEKANVLFEKAIDCAKDKQKAEILFYKGVTLLNLKKTAEAMAVFQKAIVIDPSIQHRINQIFMPQQSRK